TDHARPLAEPVASLEAPRQGPAPDLLIRLALPGVPVRETRDRHCMGLRRGSVSHLALSRGHVEAEHSIKSQQDPFFSLSPDMLCVVGGDGYFQRLSPRWHEVLGLSQEELLSRPLLDFVHPDDRATTVLSAQEFENRFACSDGTYRWLSWRVAAMPGGERGDR